MQGKKNRREKRFSLGDAAIVGIILIAIIWGAYTFGVPHPTVITTTSQGNEAPDFTLPVVNENGLSGQNVSLSSFRGRVVLLEFMEPWCPHCQKMTSVLDQLYQHFSSQNVVILSVAGPWNGASASDAAQFIIVYHSTWTYVYDGSNSAVSTYGVSSTPTFFLIAKNGEISGTYQGEVAYATLASDITRLNT